MANELDNRQSVVTPYEVLKSAGGCHYDVNASIQGVHLVLGFSSANNKQLLKHEDFEQVQEKMANELIYSYLNHRSAQMCLELLYLDKGLFSQLP